MCVRFLNPSEMGIEPRSLARSYRKEMEDKTNKKRKNTQKTNKLKYNRNSQKSKGITKTLLLD